MSGTNLNIPLKESALSGQAETFIDPTRDTADHLFYRPPEFGQADGRLIGTIAVGAGAIDDKQRIGRIFFTWIPRRLTITTGSDSIPSLFEGTNP